MAEQIEDQSGVEAAVMACNGKQKTSIGLETVHVTSTEFSET